MRKKRETEKKGSPEWMTTYSDLVTLLLCFFVLLFAFSEIDAQKFQMIMNSLQGSLGVFSGGKTIQENPYINTSNLPEDDITTEREEIEDFMKLKALIDEYAEEMGLQTQLIATIEERGLVIRILDNVFFDSGRADLKQEARSVITYIGDFLNEDEFKAKQIKVEGHTDSDPIVSSNRFPTNWELSAIRATNVLRFLVEENNIAEDRISSAGYSYYRPVAENDTPENKAKNRRVDIVVLKTAYSMWEPN